MLQDDDFGEEVFRRVEQSLGCGLQSSDPWRRKKFFSLYSERIKRNLFDRLKYIVQVQDWEYLSHTFWLKHAVVSGRFFDSMNTILQIIWLKSYIFFASGPLI